MARENTMELIAVILAAGQGKRMQSATPKVLHLIGGQPMLTRVIWAAAELSPKQTIVVHSPEALDALQAALPTIEGLSWAEQSTPKGTGHALSCAMDQVTGSGRILVLYGDVPLVCPKTLKRFVETTPEDAVGMLTFHADDPSGLGRIIREAGKIAAIVEHKDATPAQKNINEVNTGIYCVPVELLKRWLPQLACDNAQNEYYLTDIIALAAQENVDVVGMPVHEQSEVLGINNRAQWAKAEQAFQTRQAMGFIEAGVWIADPNRFTCRGSFTFGEDVHLDVGVVLEGNVVLGNNVSIGPYTHLRDVSIGDRVRVLSHSVLTQASVAKDAQVGPFARLRPGADVREQALVGNFVEVKKSVIGPKTKVPHLSYVGDAILGASVNVGAGCIFCNYDGVQKHQTVVKDNAFIGSGSQLVAPLEIGRGATVGAGTTVTKSVPDKGLCIRRATQKTVEDWDRPTAKTDEK